MSISGVKVFSWSIAGKGITTKFARRYNITNIEIMIKSINVVEHTSSAHRKDSLSLF